MPGSTYLPRTEAPLINFSANFDTRINAAPAAVGLTLAQSAAYTVLHENFVASYNLVNQNPGTRNTINVAAKNAAKRALIDGPNGIRQLVDIIQAFPGTTDVQRVELRITVRGGQPTPVPIPDAAPLFEITSIIGQSVNYKLRSAADRNRRAKPFGVQGAMILAYVGHEAPLNAALWQTRGIVTRTGGTLTFPSTFVPPGSQVWLAAAWINTRGQQGPLSSPISFYIAGGLSQAA